MQIAIVEADLSDSAHRRAVVDLVNAYAKDPMGGGNQLSRRVKERIVPGLAANPSVFAMLAYVGDQAVGIANCLVGFSTFAAMPLINIHDLAVLEEYRGQGIGRRLLESVEQKAAALGCCKVTLEVREDNEDAERLYRSLGFEDEEYGGQSVKMYSLAKLLT